VDPSIFKSVKAICPLSADDADKLHLVAVTQCGVRLFFSTTSLNVKQQFGPAVPCSPGENTGFGQPAVQPPLSPNAEAPKGLYLLHVRLPPELLLGSEPLLHLQGALVGHVHVQSQVLEAALQGAAGAGDGHHTGLHRGLDILRDLHALVGINGTHLDDTVGKNINY